MPRENVDPPGADDPALDPPPDTEEDEYSRRERVTLAELAEWYQSRGLPLDVPLSDWRPEVEGRLEDA